LAAMLQRKQPKLRQRRSLFVAKDAENAAFFAQFVEHYVH
jgi:hypothetical protein